MDLKELKTDPDLLTLLQAQAQTTSRMTAQQIRAQRISWAYGQMMGKVSRESVERIHDEQYGSPSSPPTRSPE